MAESPVPVVVDADGLFALGKVGGDDSLQARSRVVLTPHDGEYARLMGADPGPDRIAAARRLAASSGAVALLKGPTTAVADPTGRVLLGRSGTTALATAGTGDVLSGVIGAMVARGVAPLEAAALAAHVHGRAGAPVRWRGWWPATCPTWWPGPVGAAVTRRSGDPPVADHWRPAWADIDLDAVRHNASVLVRLSRPAALCAVVKADGYGHGAVPVARAALEGGATWLAVALVEEGVVLREAGIEAPILLLSEPPVEAMAEAVARRLVPTVYTDGGLELPRRRRRCGRRHRRSRSTSRWTPACTGSAPTRPTCPGWPPPSPPIPAWSSARCGPTWPWPRARARSTGTSPPASSSGSTPWWPPWPRPGTGPR